MKETVGIVGGGILGTWTAWTLKKLGLEVTLFDRAPAEGTTFAGGGLLCPFSELDNSEPLISRLGVRSIERWAEFHRAHPKFYFSRKGSLVVGHRTEKNEVTRLLNRITSAGLEREARALSPEETKELEPDLDLSRHIVHYFPNEAQLDPRAAWTTLREDFVAQGGRYFEVEVSEIAPGTLKVKGESCSFDWVVDCRGIEGKADFPRLRGVRGERITLRSPEVRIERSVRLLHHSTPLYIAPLPDSKFIVGATLLEDEHQREITVRSLLELSGSAFSLDERFAEAEIVETLSRLRPAFPDNLPQVKIEPGLIRANGLYRHGFLVSPALAEDIARAIVEKGVICKSA